MQVEALPQPRVSVITPTYNHERFIAPCVDSVLAQTFGAWEQIVLDDGSSDGTGAILQGYRDPRVRYVRQDHAGPERLAATYNRAVALARAPLIAILEGDDYWPPDKLATLVPAFDDPEVVLAFGLTEVVGEGRDGFPPVIPRPDFTRIFGAGALVNQPVGSAARAMLDFRGLTFTYPCSVIVRRRALEAIGGFQERPGMVVTDHPTFLRLALEGRFHFVPRTMGYWRVHAGSTSVARMDDILQVIGREVRSFRAEAGARLALSDEEWQAIEASWKVALGWCSLRRARRLLVERRWEEARPHLAHALTVGQLTTKLTALTGLLGSRLHFSVEPIYRLRGRPWYRLGARARADVVMRDR